MYIKIYFDDRPLFLCDELTDEIREYARQDDAVYMDEFSTAAVNTMIHEMNQQKVHAGILLHHDFEQLKKVFWKKFILIQAAGGLVTNDTGERLFIFRREKWDLPKGKREKGEKLEECALRELEEETGLKGASIHRFLLVTYHTYLENGKHFLKETHWYAMQSPGGQVLVPQLEEQITGLAWADAAQCVKIAANTYPSILDVLHAAGDQTV